MEKIFGITLLGWMNILIFQWLFIRISYHWVYVDPKNDDDARTNDFGMQRNSSLLQKLSTTMPLSGVLYL